MYNECDGIAFHLVFLCSFPPAFFKSFPNPLAFSEQETYSARKNESRGGTGLRFNWGVRAWFGVLTWLPACLQRKNCLFMEEGEEEKMKRGGGESRRECTSPPAQSRT